MPPTFFALQRLQQPHVVSFRFEPASSPLDDVARERIYMRGLHTNMLLPLVRTTWKYLPACTINVRCCSSTCRPAFPSPSRAFDSQHVEMMSNSHRLHGLD
ncbi:hypothetical protein DOTSEDRAFT_73266 [Dothistroma septosporum NZE10]|uniref:Uncharacterized protein n=1 Tax=Dothistroma septosporum (strain NZE10 / CBS 128990) TaxID=675120 RepID=N1PJT2_DOTSN|nr:hypothetical protein DOTSEDRAFT_73266 [Dothistroma septosporum NZE10]